MTERAWRRRAAVIPAGIVALAFVVSSALGAAASAQQVRVAESAAQGPSLAPGTDRLAAVVGVAWQADNTPIPAARVRLRDVASGRASAHAVANEAGRFTFSDIVPGSYAVELVNQNGKVLTVGHSFTVARGETVATFVRLGTRGPWFNGFFANAAAAVASAAAAAGVTAIAPEGIRPVSATQ